MPCRVTAVISDKGSQNIIKISLVSCLYNGYYSLFVVNEFICYSIQYPITQIHIYLDIYSIVAIPNFFPVLYSYTYLVCKSSRHYFPLLLLEINCYDFIE